MLARIAVAEGGITFQAVHAKCALRWGRPRGSTDVYGIPMIRAEIAG